MPNIKQKIETIVYWLTSGLYEMTSSPSWMFTLVGMRVKCHQPLALSRTSSYKDKTTCTYVYFVLYRLKFVETTADASE